MITLNSGTSDLIGLTQKAVKRNTVIQVIDAKQSGTPVDKEEIKNSNQDIKDKSVQVGLAAYQVNNKKSTIDTYIQSSQSTINDSNNSSNSSNNEINSFDPQAVNDARNVVHKRAIGIAVYENIQQSK